VIPSHYSRIPTSLSRAVTKYRHCATNMPLSHSNRRNESSMSEIASREPWDGLSNVTVELSVSGPFSADTQRAFPLSSDQLLTIEWE
jgi:hypothetical protein